MFEFLFKYPPAVFSRGRFVLLGSWPLWSLIVLALAGSAVLAWIFWRRRNALVPSTRGRHAIVLWGLQSAFLVLVLLLLWQPALSVTALRPQQNIVAVLVDDSQSMGTKDGSETRRDQAAKLLDGGLLKRLENRFQVRLYRLGANAARFSNTTQLHASEPATHIGTGLKEISAEAGSLPIGSIVLLSDGSDNSGGIDLATLMALRARNLPVNTIGFGSDKLSHDVEIDSVQAPTKTLVNSRVQAQVSIRQNGFEGDKAKLSITDGATVLAARDIVLRGPQQAETLEFNAGPSGPKTIYTTIDPLPGEQNTLNNRLTRVIQVDGDTRRILYIEGEPRWEFKFLRRAVEDDQALHIVSMLRTTQNKLYFQGFDSSTKRPEGFPTQPEDLFQFQGLILGSVETGFFTGSQQAIIKDFVDRRGGGLLFSADVLRLPMAATTTSHLPSFCRCVFPNAKPRSSAIWPKRISRRKAKRVSSRALKTIPRRASIIGKLCRICPIIKMLVHPSPALWFSRA